MDIPAALHRRLRIRSALEDKTMTDIVVAMLEREMTDADGHADSRGANR